MTLIGPRELQDPFSARDDVWLTNALAHLTQRHAGRFPAYSRIIGGHQRPAAIEDVPYLHVALFKHPDLFPVDEGFRGRMITSSATSTGVPSIISIDPETARLQEASTHSILSAFLPSSRAPLAVMDASSSLRRRDVSARVAAALALRPFASDIYWALETADDPTSIKWDVLTQAAEDSSALIIYGFTWVLWQAFHDSTIPDAAREALATTCVTYVHSGGWKRLEAERVTPDILTKELLARVGEGSSVLDYYGLVEQLGVVFPQCAEQRRHVPRWSKVLVRDAWTGGTLAPGETGALQLLNPLPLSTPTHSVLTEDVGYLFDSPCPCGLGGDTFFLQGRVPRAETRGCANVIPA